MRSYIKRALVGLPVALGVVLSLGATSSSAADTSAAPKDFYKKYSQGSLSFDPDLDILKVKDKKKDGRSFAVSVYGPASNGNGGVCKASGYNKVTTCNFNFKSGGLYFLVFTSKGPNQEQHWDVDEFRAMT